MNIVRSGKVFVLKHDIDKMLCESVGFDQMPVSRCTLYINKKLYNDVSFCVNECYYPCAHFMTGMIYEDNEDWYNDDAEFYAKLKKLILLIKHVNLNSVGKRKNYARWAKISTTSSPLQKHIAPGSLNRWRKKTKALYLRRVRLKGRRNTRRSLIYERYEYLIRPRYGNTRYARYIFWKRQYSRRYRNLISRG